MTAARTGGQVVPGTRIPMVCGGAAVLSAAMRAVRHLSILLPLAAALSGCGDASTLAPPSSAVARFAPALDATVDWGDVPFPSDLYRDATGAARIGTLPTPLSDTPLFAAMRATLAARDGFCTTCNVYFAIDGALAAGEIPADDPSRDASPSDAAVLADVDPGSPERGRLFPLRLEWNARLGVLALRPERGIALHRSRRYAAAITSDLVADDGTALGASEIFRRARDGERTNDPLVLRVRDAVAPALDELERAGVVRRRVVALAAFTTEDVTGDVLRVRAVVQDAGTQSVRVDEVIEGAALDRLLGTPAEDRPGIDVPPLAGSGGTRSIVHRHLAAVVRGAFTAPRVVEGTGKETGVVRRGPDGRIVTGPLEEIPFLLTIPAGVDRASLPVAVAHHGFNASRTTGFATADTAARAGVAVLAIDAFQHGDRAVTARDEVNAMRGGLPGPDGFAEADALDTSGRVFGVLGTASGLAGYTAYPHGTLLQFAADVFSAVRLVRDGTLASGVAAALADAPPGFDPARIGFVGNSLGAAVGASVLVAEPDVRAAVQNVPPGSIVETLVESPEFRSLVEAVFLPLLGLTGPYDEVERRLLLDPIVDLTRWVLEPVDPLALAPYLVRDPVRAVPAEILFQVAVQDEVAAPLATASMLAATGAPRITRYDPAAHGMLEVLEQESRYEPPVVPPFRLRAAVLPVTNPLVAEHDEIAAFLAAELAGR